MHNRYKFSVRLKLTFLQIYLRIEITFAAFFIELDTFSPVKDLFFETCFNSVIQNLLFW